MERERSELITDSRDGSGARDGEGRSGGEGRQGTTAGQGTARDGSGARDGEGRSGGEGRQGTEETWRDRELVRFVGVHGAVAISHVMAALGMSQSAAYRRIAACIDAGLLERLGLLRDAPSLLRATRSGLRYAGLGLGVAVVSPGSIDHWLRCVSTTLLLGEEFGPGQILSERELSLLERIEERAIFSAKVGELPNGTARLHRPDLAVIGGALPIAIEVELTPKSPRRLEAIIRGWRRANWVQEVRYYCPPGQTRRAVERAVAKTHAADRVQVFEVVPR